LAIFKVLLVEVEYVACRWLMADLDVMEEVVVVKADANINPDG
jgi:hypothetical protein